jgi:hypothetical protein
VIWEFKDGFGCLNVLVVSSVERLTLDDSQIRFYTRSGREGVATFSSNGESADIFNRLSSMIAGYNQRFAYIAGSDGPQEVAVNYDIDYTNQNKEVLNGAGNLS